VTLAPLPFLHRSHDAKLLPPQHTPDLAHPLFTSIVDLLEFLFLLIEPCEVVVFCHNDLGSAIELASEVRDLCFQSFHGFFSPLSLQPCPHGFSLPLLPSVILRQFPFLSHLSGVVSGDHLYPPVFLAVVGKTILPAREVSVGPSTPSLTKLLLWGPVLSWVRFHLRWPVVVVGDTWFSRSHGELWVPA